MESVKRDIAKQLQAQINAMQGLGKLSGAPEKVGLELFATAFPGSIFPSGSVHEFVSYESENAASTDGFITALSGKFMKEGSLCLWIGNKKIFPHSLKHFGLEPDRIIFIRPQKPKHILWIIEEALKCEALTAVIGEIKELGFTESRRLQLAVEHSGVTCFIHRHCPYRENNTACTTRWKITSLPSTIDDGLPGVGHSSWDVELLKVRNGKPKSWQVIWRDNSFLPMADKKLTSLSSQERNAG